MVTGFCGLFHVLMKSVIFGEMVPKWCPHSLTPYEKQRNALPGYAVTASFPGLLLVLRGLVVNVANQGAVQERFSLFPKGVPALLVALGVGDQTAYQLQNVLFAMDIREGVIVKALFEIDGVKHANPIFCPFQGVSTFAQYPSFRVYDDV